MTNSLNCPPVEAGESTAAKAAPPATPAIAGVDQAAARVAAGAPTSRPSATSQHTKRGKPRAPKPAPTASETPASVLNAACELKHELGAAEIIYVRGALELQTAQHKLSLDAGHWLLVRWEPDGQPMDGLAQAYDMTKEG